MQTQRKYIKNIVLVFIFSLSSAVSLVALPVGAATNLGSVTPFSGSEVTNPKRGQYENLGVGLFPQTNPAQSTYGTWPNTFDAGTRFDWRDLQPVDPSSLPPGATDADKYDFSSIDAAIAATAAQNKRFHFRVAAFNSCCESSYPANTNISVPDWLRGLGGATNDYNYGGNTHVIPDWNNNTYLTHMEELIAALGRRYNKDERVEGFEFSGYGDFSENHNSFMRDSLGLPGPSEGTSVATLGYYSQYEDQYITKASIIRLVDATLNAFPDTQILTTTQNPEVTKQLFRDSLELSGVSKPVGVRADCLGVYEPPQTWAVNQFSYYVTNNDPIVPILLDRWKTAPVATEWCNWVPTTEQEYFDKALTDTVNYHVSEIASTGHPYQWSGTEMPLALYNTWARTVKYSGYRYAMTDATVPDTVTQGSNLPITVEWTNFGVAPVYDEWQVRYEIRDDANNVVQTNNSSLDLKTLHAEQNYTNVNDEPAVSTDSDTAVLTASGLAPGNYTVYAKAVWNEHKPGGTNAVTYANLNFAQAGRNAGAYPVGTFQVLAAASDGSSPSTSESVPGAPNTGVGPLSAGLPILAIGIAVLGSVVSIGLLARYALRRK